MAQFRNRTVYAAQGELQMSTLGKALNVTIWMTIITVVFCISAPFILVEWLTRKEGGHF